MNTSFNESLHFIMSHPEAVARQMENLEYLLDESRRNNHALRNEIGRLRAALEFVGKWSDQPHIKQHAYGALRRDD